MPSVVVVPTKPFKGQLMGTSGLRKKVTEVTQEHYLQNFVQSIFNCLPAQTLKGKIVLGGDGRYYNTEAIQVIMQIGAANGVRHVIVGRGGYLSTPAASCVIRAHKAAGGFLLTASHNPGGPKADFGLKYNNANGGPALKELTDAIYAETQRISQYKVETSLPTPVDVSKVGTTEYPVADGSEKFVVEVIDPVDDYLHMLRGAFDLPAIKEFLARSHFRAVIDSLCAITGVYTKRIFVDELGLPESALANNHPQPDFGGHHPDPNLVYAKELVEKMFSGNFDFGAAFDGDGDRNMILGNKFFVTPSDSLAVLTANHQMIQYFHKNGFRGVARSMPTSAAVDKVVEQMAKEGKKLEFFETPTGWKFFGNLMDAGKLSLCGEESFGTGCDLIREKDGIWAALAWLSILAESNRGKTENFVGVGDVVRAHWAKFGRNYYSRYDYEEVDAEAAGRMMAHLAQLQTSGALAKAEFNGHHLVKADDFAYNDIVDGSVTKGQGIRFIFADGTRIIFRLSGTGSVGATVRVYFDMYESAKGDLGQDVAKALTKLIGLALEWSDIAKFTSRSHPTVIT